MLLECTSVSITAPKHTKLPKPESIPSKFAILNLGSSFFVNKRYANTEHTSVINNKAKNSESIGDAIGSILVTRSIIHYVSIILKYRAKSNHIHYFHTVSKMQFEL